MGNLSKKLPVRAARNQTKGSGARAKAILLEQSGDLVVEEKQTYMISTFKQHPVIEEKIDLTGAIQLAFEELSHIWSLRIVPFIKK